MSVLMIPAGHRDVRIPALHFPVRRLAVASRANFEAAYGPRGESRCFRPPRCLTRSRCPWPACRRTAACSESREYSLHARRRIVEGQPSIEPRRSIPALLTSASIGPCLAMMPPPTRRVAESTSSPYDDRRAPPRQGAHSGAFAGSRIVPNTVPARATRGTRLPIPTRSGDRTTPVTALPDRWLPNDAHRSPTFILAVFSVATAAVARSTTTEIRVSSCRRSASNQ